MFVVIWEYEVHPGQQAQFEALYGPRGEWAVLFAAHAGHVGTELLRGPDGHYLTIDRWHSAQAYDTFLEQARDAYARIDAAGDALTASERCVGRYATAP